MVSKNSGDESSYSFYDLLKLDSKIKNHFSVKNNCKWMHEMLVIGVDKNKYIFNKIFGKFMQMKSNTV